MPAMEALLQRCLPPLKRWAHGRLPAAARGRSIPATSCRRPPCTCSAISATFEPRHVGAMQAYLRQSVINRICDEVRRIGRQPPPLELPEDHPSDAYRRSKTRSAAEAYEHYRDAVSRLSPKDRALIVARIEMQWGLAEIAHRYGMPTVDAAQDGREPRGQAAVGGFRRAQEITKRFSHAECEDQQPDARMCSGFFLYGASSSSPPCRRVNYSRADGTWPALSSSSRRTEMFARKIVHTLCGVVLLGVLATPSTGAMSSTCSRTTHFTFSGGTAARRHAAGRHLHLRSRESGQRLRRRQRDVPRSDEGVSHAVHAFHPSPAAGT